MLIFPFFFIEIMMMILMMMMLVMTLVQVAFYVFFPVLQFHRFDFDHCPSFQDFPSKNCLTLFLFVLQTFLVLFFSWNHRVFTIYFCVFSREIAVEYSLIVQNRCVFTIFLVFWIFAVFLNRFSFTIILVFWIFVVFLNRFSFTIFSSVLNFRSFSQPL